MSAQDNGGPAFPVWELNGNGQPEMTGFGMTLRDYFAAKIIAGMNASLVESSAWPDAAAAEKMAEVAFLQADAMLAARAKGEPA